MLTLNNVTLACVDTTPNVYRVVQALYYSMKQVGFGRVVFFTAAPHVLPGIEVVVLPPSQQVGSKEEYSRFMIRDLPHYIDTDFVLVSQWDGFVRNVTAWTNEFQDYDYIGSAWDKDYHCFGGIAPGHDPKDYMVGNGGFSLRSKKFLSACVDISPFLYDYHPEDTVLGWPGADHLPRHRLAYPRDSEYVVDVLRDKYNIEFAPVELAKRFSIERNYIDQFGFHSSTDENHLVPEILKEIVLK